MSRLVHAAASVNGVVDLDVLRGWVFDGQPPAEQTGGTAVRPAQVDANEWRRMSPMSRSVLALCAPLLDGVDAVVWGTHVGEIEPTERFLTRLFTRGHERCSPLSFQTSVYNAAAGHLSIAFGLTGPSETLSAGGATGLAVLTRALDLLALGRAQRVLAVAAEPATPLLQAATQVAGCPGTHAATAAALVLDAQPGGTQVTAGPGPAGMPHAGPLLTRHLRLPLEEPLSATEGLALEGVFGLSASAGMVAVALLADRGGMVIDHDGPAQWTATVQP